MTVGTTPSREEILACYRPIRASIQAVLAEAVKQCKKPDLDRAAKHFDLIDQEQLDDEAAFAMLCDVALFEPNQRGRRVIDSFLDKRLGALPLPDRDVAHKLASAFFSMFCVAGWHGAGGVWLDDLLKPGRRIWLMDESLETSASKGLVIAMRVFDAGPFYAGFGIVVHPDAEAVTLCIHSRLSRAAAAGSALACRRPLRRRDSRGIADPDLKRGRDGCSRYDERRGRAAVSEVEAAQLMSTPWS